MPFPGHSPAGKTAAAVTVSDDDSHLQRRVVRSDETPEP
jgi:hypothetical protein